MEQYHVGLYGYVTSHHIALRQCEHLTRGGPFRPAFMPGMLAQWAWARIRPGSCSLVRVAILHAGPWRYGVGAVARSASSLEADL